ncbi:acrosin-like [Cydia pomonella]|uniref:acrosin-like n=1 Tax=Cydia pomonella TaxID=82600 RepID=UPI002ADD5BA2|nr:acrosin-like [Cydia pomonella]
MFYKILICVALSMLEVESMAIEGSVLTRYDPCGLGVLQFDKVSAAEWRGVVYFELYPHLTEVEMDIQFERQVELYGSSQNSTMSVRDDWHRFILRPKGALPKQYYFFLRLADNSTQVPTVANFKLNNTTLCDDAIKAAQTIESLNVTTNPKEVYKQVCGRRALEHAELTSVRTQALAGDWPWHVALLKKNPNSYATRYECGGSIISSTAVLTAGHCVSRGGVLIEARLVVIVAGVNNHTDYNQIGRQALVAQDIVLHPGYTDALATSDLAIIKVHKFTYTAFVQPVCLWGPVYSKEDLFGKQATVVGFGYTETNQPSDVLRSAYIMIQNDTTCLSYSQKVYKNLLNEFSFCAGYGPTSGVNPRNGDSGGGLVLGVLQSDHKISYILRGVLSKCGVSVGHTECDPKHYVVYTDVAPHYTWLYHHSGLKYRSNIL